MKLILLKLMKYQRPDIDKIDLFVKDSFESKCNYLLMEE